MAETVRELIVGNLDMPLISRKEGQAVTVEKGLTAGARAQSYCKFIDKQSQNTCELSVKGHIKP